MVEYPTFFLVMEHDFNDVGNISRRCNKSKVVIPKMDNRKGM
jgi:hypothetical protein